MLTRLHNHKPCSFQQYGIKIKHDNYVKLIHINLNDDLCINKTPKVYQINTVENQKKYTKTCIKRTFKSEMYIYHSEGEGEMPRFSFLLNKTTGLTTTNNTTK